MSNKTIGKDIANPIQREQFIKDNADGVENKGYMKAYTPEQLQGHKEKLANVSIEIAEIEAELKAVQAEYKGRLKPLKKPVPTWFPTSRQKPNMCMNLVTVLLTAKKNKRVITTPTAIWWNCARQPPKNCN